MFLIRGLVTRILVLAVVVLVAAGAGWWFFIREDNHVQKAAAEVTDDVRQAAASPTAGSAGTTPHSTAAGGGEGGAPGASSIAGQSYRIVEGQSQAWYLAPEKLASLPTSSVAKGTTSDVKGEFHLTADGLDASQPSAFTVGLASLKSDQSRRDGMVQRALETTKYQSATFTATKLTGMPAQFGDTDSVLQLTGMLDLHGVQKEVTWELKVKKDAASNILSGLATVELKYSDFNIRKPDIGGFVSVEDNVTIQVQLFATPA
jgi:polyisoprenoid-binding protein YceI